MTPTPSSLKSGNHGWCMHFLCSLKPSQLGLPMMGNLDAPEPLSSPSSSLLDSLSFHPPFSLSFLQFPTFQMHNPLPCSVTFLPNFPQVSALFSSSSWHVKTAYCTTVGVLVGAGDTSLLWETFPGPPGLYGLIDDAYLLLLCQSSAFLYCQVMYWGFQICTKHTQTIENK